VSLRGGSRFPLFSVRFSFHQTLLKRYI